jgi:hypothetical protein
MAYAPLAGQDGGSCAFDLPDEASGMFFTGYLDDPNRLDLASEFSFVARGAMLGQSRERGLNAGRG